MTEYEILENINKCKKKILGTRLFGAIVIIFAVLSYALEWSSYITLGLVIPSSLFVFLGFGLPSMLNLSKLKKELSKLQHENTL